MRRRSQNLLAPVARCYLAAARRLLAPAPHRERPARATLALHARWSRSARARGLANAPCVEQAPSRGMEPHRRRCGRWPPSASCVTVGGGTGRSEVRRDGGHDQVRRRRSRRCLRPMPRFLEARLGPSPAITRAFRRRVTCRLGGRVLTFRVDVEIGTRLALQTRWRTVRGK